MTLAALKNGPSAISYPVFDKQHTLPGSGIDRRTRRSIAMLADTNQPFPGTRSTAKACEQHTARMQFIFELLLQPILELVFYVLGYATAWVIVPVFTFGHVTVEPGPDGRFLKPKRGRIQRVGPGKYVMEAEMAVWVGVLFWVLVAIGAYLLRSS